MPDISPEARAARQANARKATAAAAEANRQRRNDKRLAGLQADAPLTEAQLAGMREDYLTQLLAAAPPMSPEQLAICRQLLPPVPVDADGQLVARPEPARRPR